MSTSIFLTVPEADVIAAEVQSILDRHLASIPAERRPRVSSGIVRLVLDAALEHGVVRARD